jgi:hypothetical protein
VVADELLGERHLLAPPRPRVVHDLLVGDGAVLAGEADAEPHPLDVGHVPHQAERRHHRGLDRAAGQLLGVQAVALDR